MCKYLIFMFCTQICAVLCFFFFFLGSTTLGNFLLPEEFLLVYVFVLSASHTTHTIFLFQYKNNVFISHSLLKNICAMIKNLKLSGLFAVLFLFVLFCFRTKYDFHSLLTSVTNFPLYFKI